MADEPLKQAAEEGSAQMPNPKPAPKPVHIVIKVPVGILTGRGSGG